MPTAKIFEKGGYIAEKGRTTGQSAGWGQTGSGRNPATAFPWLTFGNELTINTKTDESVNGFGFKQAPRITGERVDNPLSFYARFNGLDYFTYWMFGFEHVAKSVVVFKTTTGFVGGTPTLNLLFTTQGEDFLYLRTIETKDENGDLIYLYVFAGDVILLLQTGTLTAGAITLVYTGASGVLYDHVYEVDASARNYRLFTTAERSLLNTEGANPVVADTDKRNLMASLGKRMEQYDIQYPNAICSGWTYKVTPDDMAMFDTKFLAYTQNRGEYDSETWAQDADLEDNVNIPAHYQHTLKIGTTMANMVKICATEMSVKCEIPLQQIQTTCSFTHIAEPVLSGQTDLAFSATIARAEADTYVDYRQNMTRLCASLVATYGYFTSEMYMSRIVLTKSGADDGDVAAEPLEGAIVRVPDAENPFVKIQDFTSATGSPLVYRVINDNPACAMLAV